MIEDVDFERIKTEKVTDGNEKVTCEVILVFQNPLTFEFSFEPRIIKYEVHNMDNLTTKAFIYSGFSF